MRLEMSCLSAMVCSITVEVITMPSVYLAIAAITGTTRAISYFHSQQYRWLVARSDLFSHSGASFVRLG